MLNCCYVALSDDLTITDNRTPQIMLVFTNFTFENKKMFSGFRFEARV